MGGELFWHQLFCCGQTCIILSLWESDLESSALECELHSHLSQLPFWLQWFPYVTKQENHLEKQYPQPLYAIGRGLVMVCIIQNFLPNVREN